MPIYKAAIVEAIQTYYGETLVPSEAMPKIQEHLQVIAQLLWEGLQTEYLPLFQEINNYHPDFLGLPIEVLLKRNWTLEEAQQCIASEYGFKHWKAIENLGSLEYDLSFEQAVTALLNGDAQGLETLLETQPYLAKAQSRYGHQATLLHYTASNGVELWRQQVPPKLPQILALLLEKGMDKEAKMKVYGGTFTTLELLKSSAHPVDAGLLEPILAILEGT